MTAVGQWRATYAPGDWLVLSGPTSVVVLEPPGAGWTPLAAELWQEVLASSSLRDLAARLAAYGLDTMPSFGALFWTPDGMRSLVRGAVRILDAGSGQVLAQGHDVQTWSEVGLGEVRLVRVETGGVVDEDALQLPLVVGAVRASSVLLDARPEARVQSPQRADRTAGSEPAGTAVAPTSRTERPAGPHAGQAAEAEPEHTEALPLRTPPEEVGGEGRVQEGARGGTVPLPGPSETTDADTEPMAEPLTPPPVDPAGGADPSASATVLAVVCPHGHPNRPGSARCTDCGVRIADPQPRPVPQPVLATLRSTDGTDVPLDGPVLVGRAPAQQGGARARLLTVPSPSHDISRTHLEVVPDGWRILVRDLHSTNGTVLLAPDGVTRRPLPPGESVPVPLGSVLELADGIAVLLDLAQ